MTRLVGNTADVERVMGDSNDFSQDREAADALEDFFNSEGFDGFNLAKVEALEWASRGVVAIAEGTDAASLIAGSWAAGLDVGIRLAKERYS